MVSVIPYSENADGLAITLGQDYLRFEMTWIEGHLSFYLFINSIFVFLLYNDRL